MKPAPMLSSFLVGPLAWAVLWATPASLAQESQLELVEPQEPTAGMVPS